MSYKRLMVHLHGQFLPRRMNGQVWSWYAAMCPALTLVLSTTPSFLLLETLSNLAGVGKQVRNLST